MTEKLKQTIKEEIMRLPKEAQEAVNALDWAKVAEEIGKKHLLSENEITDFQTETLLMLIGLTDGEDYAVSIENNVGTSKDEAEKMANEANQKIFTPMYDILEENIKKNLKNKNINAAQNIDFILSGGDYSVFITPTQVENEKTNKLLGASNILEVKDRLIP